MTALKLWNEFLKLLPIHEEPCSPVWSMEFGMDYDLNDLRVEGLAIEDFKRKTILKICHLTYQICSPRMVF